LQELSHASFRLDSINQSLVRPAPGPHSDRQYAMRAVLFNIIHVMRITVCGGSASLGRTILARSHGTTVSRNSSASRLSAHRGDLESAQAKRTALMCAERDAHACHRWLIADYCALAHGQAVYHWSTTMREPDFHVASDCARLSSGATAAIAYDVGLTGRLAMPGENHIDGGDNDAES